MIENDLLESIVIIMNNITIIVMKCNMLYVTNFFVFFITLVSKDIYLCTCIQFETQKQSYVVRLVFP